MADRALADTAELMDSTVVFGIELFCTETNLAENQALSFSELPKTALRVKERVEDQFCIPVCVQSLSYETHHLSDDTTLEEARIRAGDKFLVKYSSKANCKEIDEVVAWFGMVKTYLLAENPSLDNPLSQDFEDTLMQGMREEFIENMAFKYLFPWLDAKKYANKLYFVYSGGLGVVMDIYAAVHCHPWDKCLLKLKYLEYGILRILWNLSETFELRRLILQHNNGLSLCIKSLLRQKVEEGKAIEDTTMMESHQTNSWVLVENIGAALGLLCK